MFSGIGTVAKSDSSGCDSMSVFEVFLKRTTSSEYSEYLHHCADRYSALLTIYAIVRFHLMQL
jgi:hypothetical protein